MTTDAPRPANSPDGYVRTDIADGIGRIEFFHPKSNALPSAILRDLAAAVTAVGADPSVRVIVLQSGGTGPFCAGASFDELTAIASPEQGQEFFSGFARVILAMIRAPKFVISRVHGKAAGGAVGLIAASDFSMAVTKASAKLSELAVGIGPFVVGPVIEKKIGLAAFGAMSVDADWRDAAWGERHGLYAKLFDDVAAMDDAVTALATTLAASNPEAMAMLKRVFWAGTEQWETLLAERAGMSGTLVLSEFTRNAIGAFKTR
ncbi:enoyl-CoA hydratase/isomerase family protein [Gemmatimonas groenlandica]|uniref:Enoyl-CoA hydratase/isomerase family protein n=1 Tax=Gemmatimonas groenlandica TaxID=2732249 RepID=A0A6M4IQG6_9BACT|nr:enoyl-CoA hydratase/isomerase family protein [Gemmatimonas groenlandica]QJR35727.1 enoyl-CoA hydratase/isomerase family protein [Gemmatimonas groenlandica]